MCHVRRGYTLLEMLLVLALIVILAALVVPSLQSAYAQYKLRASADTVRAAWANARSWAIDSGRPYRFDITPDKGNYRVVPADTGSDSMGGADNTVRTLEASLPDGINFEFGQGSSGPAAPSVPTMGGGDGNWQTVATFLPDGTARENVEITIRAKKIPPLVVRLRGLTGAVTVRRQGE